MKTIKRPLRPAVLTAFVFLASAAGALERVDLKVQGHDEDDLFDAVRASSSLMNLQDKEAATPGEVLAAARTEYTHLTEALYAQGYYSVVVNVLVDGREAALIDPFAPPETIEAVEIQVNPGRAFRFGKARIEPRSPMAEELEGFRSGEVAQSTVVVDSAQQTVYDWRRAGHAKAKISDQSVLVRHNAAELDVDVKVAPGPKVSFGGVEVSGVSKVRPTRVKRIAGIPEGEVYSPEAVEKAAKRLRSTGTFKSVQITEAETVADDGSMDVDIAVVDAKPRRIGAGIEMSSFDGLTLSGYWLHRNILGGAERLRIDGGVAQLGGVGSGIDYSLSFRLEKPAVYGPDTMFAAEAGLYYVDEPDFHEEKAEIKFSVSRAFTDQLTGDLGIGYAFSRVTDFYLTPHVTRELEVVSLPLGVTYDTRDNPLDARKGLYIKSVLTPFYELRAGNSGGHFTFDGRAYRALSADTDSTVIAGRLQIGSLVGPSALSAPPDFLFYSGGGGTVRGQPYNSLGADYGAVTIGGRSFAALSGEVRFPVTDSLGLVAFADAGFVGPDGFDAGDWHAGAGMGVRYKTPVGPIRLDLAGPVAGNTGSGMQLYIGIGQAF